MIRTIVLAIIGVMAPAVMWAVGRRAGKQGAKQDQNLEEMRDEIQAGKNIEAARDAARADPDGVDDRLRDAAARGLGRRGL